jgi:molybdopterin converting factor small subunit
MGSDKTIDQQLQDLEAVPESELLVLPEANIPAGLLAAIWERTAVIKEKKQEDETVLRIDTQERRVEQSKERARNDARELAFEQFQATMQDVQERSEKLLERLAQREIVARQHLREIDERAIVLKDGRHVYVGGKGEYLDAQGKALDGQDRTMPARSISKIRWPQGGRKKPMPSNRSNKPCS